MPDYLKKLKTYASDKAADYLDEKGLQVHLKTDLWNSIKVYDSDAPVSDSTLPIKYSVTLTSRDGRVLKQYNDTPAVNPIKAAAIIAITGAGIYFLLAGAYTTMSKILK